MLALLDQNPLALVLDLDQVLLEVETELDFLDHPQSVKEVVKEHQVEVKDKASEPLELDLVLVKALDQK